MNYLASYKIRHGVAGFGRLSEEDSELREEIIAENDGKAVETALRKACYFAFEYLTGPDGFNLVELSSLSIGGRNLIENPVILRASHEDHMMNTFSGNKMEKAPLEKLIPYLQRYENRSNTRP